MVFNWFRRKFGSSGEEPSPAAETPTESPPPESTEPTTESTAAPSILNWAKTALQSIQARQQSESAATVEPPEASQKTPADSPVSVSEESEKTAVTDSAPVQPVGEAEPVEPNPPLVLNEGFLWSAEVLAAQGRRPEEVDIEEITWLQRLRQGLGKTRRGLVNQLRAIVGQGPLSRDAVEEIEMLLLQSDVGVKATDQIIAALQTKIRQETLPADQAIAYLKEILRDILDRPFQQGYRRDFAPKKGVLNIWLIAGVNGVGKTTTIGKLAHIATHSGYRCLIAAADTFRAAATEQVKIWGQRSNVEVIANPGKNTDPAAVVFDAIGAAQARGTELLLVDTAGRLQNKANLMEELKKIRRIIDKKAGDAQIESLLVLDATLGQNGLRQAQVFAEAAQLTGVILTKLDGTAKGGVALAVVQELGLPIRFIGAGEGIKDLRPFSSFEFVEALLSSDVEVAA
ncbi:MAG: signal recognition particle-docking protein FtsY [Thermosynechococcus sp. Uc]|uniref:signal recognition particle-docking protein FtsY n=1 Tax=Thermosynechococcus sp. Uc TaxID=3034853 RepID=UPI00259DF904|nr:signal recognition particle-docking protein FtsY [Thermosynechococcus sp. Uc]MDM7326129.1 signal recognition particle-docking protein FtsY [Thermosynechococcus sp. Uc]